MPDHVDSVLDQWRRERPDVDVSGMAIIGRISRLERQLRARLDEVFAEHGLESWEFDLLATLRRSGHPFQLTAGDLLKSMMVTSGAVTNRIDRLEHRSFVRRRKHPNDGRIVVVQLTEIGKRKIDEALGSHAANELRIINLLNETDRTALTASLRAFATALETDAK